MEQHVSKPGRWNEFEISAKFGLFGAFRGLEDIWCGIYVLEM
jgi:hypothetical protein